MDASILHSAFWIMVLLALLFTMLSGLTNPSKIPLWIAVLFVVVALMVLGVPSH
jgi:hypothetical protein